MKRFHFSLKSVATLREAREARVRDSFIAAVRAVAAAEAALVRIGAERSGLEREVLKQRQGSFRAADQIAFLKAHSQVVVREGEARTAVHDATRAREERRQEWMEARRDVRLVEKLRESALRDHRRGMEREAQRLLDEHTSATVARESGAIV